MAIKLSELKPPPGSRHKRKRRGCGPGSGHGKTACRGSKGQKSRSGSTSPPWFQGGQMPLQRQIPKRGFRSHRTLTYEVVNLRDLNLFEAGSLVDDSELREKGILTKRRPVKILAKGTLSKPLTVRAAAFSTKAREAIESAGGKAEVVNSVR